MKRHPAISLILAWLVYVAIFATIGDYLLIALWVAMDVLGAAWNRIERIQASVAENWQAVLIALAVGILLYLHSLRESIERR